MKQEIREKVDGYRKIIEDELSQCLPPSDRIGEAMRYSTLGGGKRIRGVLTLEFCRVFGGDTGKAVCTAAAVEMLHAFSLIHDDLPCMDDDDIRRGKPSCHKQFGEATALLAGDGLLACAVNSAAASAFVPKGLKPQNVVSVISALSNATVEMVKGQQLDMDFESVGNIKKLSEDDLIGMYNRKTCALISAACVCGAICANASDKNIHKARVYGVALGLAFQLTDDLLDIETEKPSKKTLPLLIGEKKTREKIQEYTATAVKTAKSISGGEFLEELAESLVNRSF